MGFDLNRFVGLGGLEDDLTCCICCGVFDCPVVTPCGHTFCKDCVIKWFEQERSCPVCRKSVYKLCRPPIILNNIIGKQLIRCDHHERGCVESVPLDSLPAHCEGCEKKPRENAIRTFIKKYFNFSVPLNCPLTESPLDYDGELVSEPERQSRARRTRRGQTEPPNIRILVLKIISLCILFIAGIFSVKLILWSYKLLGFVIQLAWDMTGLSVLNVIRDVVEKVAVGALSFAASLGVMFFLSTLVALYNY